MDYGSRWAEPQAAPSPHHHLFYAPPHLHPDMIHHHQQPQPLPRSSSSSAAATYYYPNPNPNRGPTPSHDAHLPSGAGVEALLPPAADTFPPHPYSSHGRYQGLHAVPYSYSGTVPPPAAAAAVGAPSSYYYGGGGEDPHSLAVKEAIRQFGVDPHSYGPIQASSSNGLEPASPTQVRPPRLHGRASRLTSKKAMNKGSKKGSNRTTKVVQSAYCEVCKIECYTPEVLKIHKQGKKHKKKLQKLQDSITAKPAKAPTTTMESKETPDADKSKAGGEKNKKKGAPATAEDLEAKKRRVLEGGAAVDGVKVCTICNVVVNSQKVFEYHIAGQRHNAMAKKLQEHQVADASI